MCANVILDDSTPTDMTKEEYERLLQSDYWKGYSYSLIKERNFTCEDCGRSFPNERNRLQVHHLVYRDVNPWSYRPEEVVVLCEECHKRRHGILPECEPKPEIREETETPRQAATSSGERDGGRYAVDGGMKTNDPFSDEKKSRKKVMALGLLMVALLLVAGLHGRLGSDYVDPYEDDFHEEAEAIPESHPLSNPGGGGAGKARSVARSSARDDLPVGLDPIPELKVEAEELTKEGPAADLSNHSVRPESAGSQREKSTLEILEERNHANAVEQARKAGVSTEGTTLEILERINHANAVEQGKRAGVSTEGSTLDILERINHANAVEQGKRAGVSTEGSTLDILERINHANAVEQARRAGVSTEGTTLEILERINRKNLEKYSH